MESNSLPQPARAVTFDCWNTLLYEEDPRLAQGRRVEALERSARDLGLEPGPGAAERALEDAWQRHIGLWRQGLCSGPEDIASWALGALGAEPDESPELVRAFGEASLEARILPLEGAAATLERLARAGVRRALVCDTGLSPGRVVRDLLARAGLLEWLEVLVFSDEEGVPKPHPRMFDAALAPLGVEAAAAIHVGDLRRTDIAGAREFGMATVRIRHRHDDETQLPEADAVADSHAHLVQLLGF